MKEEKRLIETRLPLAEIDEEVGKEKAVGGTPRTSRLLFWWTRKPLSVARASVLGAILPAEYPLDDFKRDLRLGKKKRMYNYTPIRGKVSRSTTMPTDIGEVKVLDPMAGGGSIPFEAMRSGTQTVALDYNPVAFIILKATLEYPKIWGPQLVADVEFWGREVLRRAENEIGHLYPQHRGRSPSHYVWCWVAECPRCGQKNPLVSQWWLVRKKGRRLGLKPVLIDRKSSSGEIDHDFDLEFVKDPPQGTVTHGRSTCIRCGAPITQERLKEQISMGKRKLLCVVVPTSGGKLYEKPSKEDLAAIDAAERLLDENKAMFVSMGLMPDDEIPDYDTRAIWIVKYGFHKWHQLYSPRQLLVMLTLAKQIILAAMGITKERGKEYAKAVVTYLAMLLCQHARFNCLATCWHRTGEQIGHVFQFRGISVTWDHAEVNPFSEKGAGTWRILHSSICSALKFTTESLATSGSIDVHLGSALKLPFEERYFDIIVTDPPYLDDVPYGELSEFYYVWLWRILHSYYPELPGPKVPVDEELDHSSGRHGSADLSREFYLNGLTDSFRQMRRVLADDGLMILFFAHSKRQAWKILISSLVNSGFRVTMTWPVRTESPTSIVQMGKASMQSSILVAARKRIGGGTAFLEDLRDEVADHVRKGLEEISDLKLIGADLIVAGMGKALEVTTQYSELKSYSGTATLETMLEVVSKAVFSYSIEKLVRRPLAALDPQTAFYVFVKCSYAGVIPPDDALMICKGAGVELQALQHEKIIDKKKIGTRTILATLNAYERDLDLEKPPHTPTILDQLHLLELAVQKHGKKGFDRLLSSPTFRAGDVRAVAEGLYNGLLLIKKNDPEIELLRPIIDLFKTGAPSPAQDTIDKYFTEGE